jgi:hypothetical protein
MGTICYRMLSLDVSFVWIPNYVSHEFMWFNVTHVMDAH